MDPINEKHLDGPGRKVGMQGKKPVLQYRTKGGLYMVGIAKTSGMEILGTGPHRAVARIGAEKTIAKKGEEEIVWTELSKSDHVPPEHYELILPEYEALTLRMRILNGDEVAE